jgi:hypothetical protein
MARTKTTPMRRIVISGNRATGKIIRKVICKPQRPKRYRPGQLALK